MSQCSARGEELTLAWSCALIEINCKQNVGIHQDVGIAALTCIVEEANPSRTALGIRFAIVQTDFLKCLIDQASISGTVP
jgi:hypothetical protein